MTGPRPVRAPRGTELSCRGWPQEAALRMLMNNLDPEVAERPDDLVVYGGTGKAARSWDAFDAIVAHAAHASRTTRRCWCSRASRSASSAPTSGRRACSSPTRNLVGRVGQLGRVPRASRTLGLTMYGQMTAGSWIYIGTQGILQGTYETLRRDRAASSFGGIAGGHDHADRRASAAWAARSRWPSP